MLLWCKRFEIQNLEKSQVMSAFIPKTDPMLSNSIFTLCLFFDRSKPLTLCQISDILHFSGVAEAIQIQFKLEQVKKKSL